MGTVTEMRLGTGLEPGANRYRFNYKGMHRYLITLETHISSPVFSEGGNVMKVLTTLREAGWNNHFDIYAYCFLPSRLVLIARGKSEDSDMKSFLASFRSSSSEALKTTLGMTLWKKKYTERVLRKSEDSKAVAAEVFQLAVKAGLATKAEEYPYHGSFVTNLDKPKPVRKDWKKPFAGKRTPQRRPPRRT